MTASPYKREPIFASRDMLKHRKRGTQSCSSSKLHIETVNMMMMMLLLLFSHDLSIAKSLSLGTLDLREQVLSLWNLSHLLDVYF